MMLLVRGKGISWGRRRRSKNRLKDEEEESEDEEESSSFDLKLENSKIFWV
jgi:hypothetical protein